jgi:outer membrane protein OmpA-like peptidoglycan-associated protein
MAVDAAKTGIPGNLTSRVGSGGLASKVLDMLKNLFVDKASGLTNAIAGFSGISGQSASTLMSVAAPAALGVLGKHAIDTNMNAGGLLSFLNTQKDHILNAVPSGLNLAGVLGMGSLAGIGSKLSGALSGVTGAVGHQAERLSHAGTEMRDRAKSGSRWVWPLLLALIAIGLIWYFMNRNKPTETAAVPAMDSVAVKDTVSTVPVDAPYTVKLPDGTVLNAKKGGIEDQLVIFLNDPSSKPGKDVWFNFDQLNFNTGSADISPSSSEQVKNIALILKAYPKVKIKIGGYTDRTGDSVVNKKLSNSRAMSVASAIKADGGSAAQIIGAEGYGSAFAKYPMDATDSLKAMDRHISVSVRSK